MTDYTYTISIPPTNPTTLPEGCVHGASGAFSPIVLVNKATKRRQLMAGDTITFLTSILSINPIATITMCMQNGSAKSPFIGVECPYQVLNQAKIKVDQIEGFATWDIWFSIMIPAIGTSPCVTYYIADPEVQTGTGVGGNVKHHK
jgi:hypothetical protein